MTDATNLKPSPARDRILATADRLFYRDGLRATGIDRIIAESGVAKMSFYRHFPAKADLIASYLEARHARWMAWFRQEITLRLAAPGTGLAAIADVLESWFGQAEFRGCTFINTIAESGADDSAERRLAQDHKRELLNYLAELAGTLGHEDTASIAEAVLVIIEGAIVRRQMEGGAGVVPACRRLLKGLDKERPARG